VTSLAQRLRLIAGKIELGEDAREDVGALLRAADILSRFMAIAAQRYISVAELSKSDTVSDLSIPLKSLYLLAAPSTPEEVRKEIIARPTP
jgi:hypothetical protein